MTASPAHLSPEEPEDTFGVAKMGFLEHLDELRRRLIRSLIAVAAGMLVAFFFIDRIGDFILAPTLRTLPPGEALVYTKPGEGLAFYFDVALIGGVVLAAPFVMYQVWCFIAPGLYAKEKRLAFPFVALTTLGSLGGALFTHYIMFPSTIAFLGAFHSPSMKFMPRVEDTFELYKGMVLGMVAVFQLPTLIFFLAKVGLVTAGFLWRNMKYAILLIFIAAAVLTSSPDMWNQTIFAAPMIVLYLMSILIAWIVAPVDAHQANAERESTKLRLVIGAMVLEQARKHKQPSTRRQL
jgi:sec-independent protein translocase protein TatC